MATSSAEKIPSEGFEYKGIFYPNIFSQKSLEQIESTTFDDSDTLVLTYPKSGTTWVNNIAWMISQDAEESLVSLDMRERLHRVLFLEMHTPGRPGVRGIDIAQSKDPPRIITSHLNMRFFEKTLKNKKAKFIIVMRNVKDLLVSYYHMHQSTPVFGFTGPWSDFLDLFHSQSLTYGDYFDFNLAWWNNRSNENIMIIKYEDLLDDPVKGVSQIAEFMGKKVTPERVNYIVAKTSFSSMQKDATDKSFYRKGKVGSWKEQFTQDQAAKVDAAIVDRLAGTGLEFQYE